MDNPQASLREAMVAGMWLADGFVSSAYRENRTRGKTMTLVPQAGYTSKDYDYIEFISQVLSENDVGHYIIERKRIPKRARTWNLTVIGHKRFRAWYQLFRPHLFGRKAEIADALFATHDPLAGGYGPKPKPQEQQDKELAAHLLTRRLNSTEASETIMVGAA